MNFCKMFSGKSLVDLPKRHIGRISVFFLLSQQHDTAQYQEIRRSQHGLSLLEEELTPGVSASGCSDS